ncbi:MAG: membrane protein insertion efficiency factor YidD [Elusimicrobia bacterium]|nr:membrane protein insertion efficiency factor YidD [Elusimicrobiota bacterium]
MKNIITISILAYQMLTRGLFPPSCRYAVSCSDFTLQAVRVHGAGRGLLMGWHRLMTCHPFSRVYFGKSRL